MVCGADANVQSNMVKDDAGNLGPIQMDRISTGERAKAVNIYDWMLRWNVRAANTFSYVDARDDCGTRMTPEEAELGVASRQLDYIS